MYFKKIVLASLLVGSSLYGKNSIGININNDDVELQSSIDMNSLADYATGTTYLLDINYLHIGKPSSNLLSVGFSGQNSLQGVQGLKLAFGAKLIFANEYAALPLMAKVAYTLPLALEIPKTDIIASYAFAPSVLTFRDGDNYSEFRLEGDVEIIPNVHIFAGYRNIDTDYQIGNLTLDREFNESFYAGLKLTF